MWIRLILLLVVFIYHISYSDVDVSLLLLYLIVLGSSISYFYSLNNIFDLRIWFVPLFTVTNSLSIASEEYLLGGVKILSSYSPLKILTSLFIFNISMEIFSIIKRKTDVLINHEIEYNFSYVKVIFMMIITYSYFIFDFIRLDGFSHLSSYGENQYEYSIYDVLMNFFTITWSIGVILISTRLKGILLASWFLYNIIFIIITRVLLGFRGIMVLLLIIMLFTIIGKYRIKKSIMLLLGICIFVIHSSFGIYRGGADFKIEDILFQLGMEFSIISQINYVVFNEFTSYKYGFSFISGFINIIPGARILFTDYLFYPALFFNSELVTKNENQGYGFSFLSELYMNFGIWGASLFPLFLTYINSFFNAAYGSLKWILSSILIYLLSRILRSDSIEFIKVISYSYFTLQFLKIKNKK